VSEQDGSKPEDEDTYIIEDSGETLETFDLEREEQAAHQPDSESTGIAAVIDESALANLHRENSELRDRLLRTRADFDNFRKRVEREKADFFKYALGEIMRELLPVLDNFERALSARSDSASDILAGVELIYKQLYDCLAKAGLSPIDTAGGPFDPAIHEGVTREETAALPPHSVAEILQKGYMLHDRLLRAAMVKVSVLPADLPAVEPEVES
jgi:molecular chaperone GrpE